MAYRMTFKTKDEVPSELTEAATEQDDGTYAVSLVPKSKVDEFRESNINLSKKVEEMGGLQDRVSKFFTESTPDLDALGNELTELRTTAQKVKDGKLKGSDAVEAEVTKRVSNLQEAHAAKITDMQKQIATLSATVEEKEQLIRGSILERAIDGIISDENIGLNPSARADIVGRATRIFSVSDDGTITAKNAKGETIWGDDGKSSLSLTEWANGDLKKNGKHLFLPSKGASDPFDYEKENGRDIPSREARKNMSLDDLWARAT